MNMHVRLPAVYAGTKPWLTDDVLPGLLKGARRVVAASFLVKHSRMLPLHMLRWCVVQVPR